jgi:hypothetical protein
MSRVFISDSTGAVIHVFSEDHCPPHVHVRHRGDSWIARARFSYLDTSVTLMSIAPLQNAPLQRTVNRLLADIQGGLPGCRRSWWTMRRTTCLANQWVVRLAPEKIELSPEFGTNAKQVADAGYDPDRQRLRVTFKDGTTAEVSIRA